MVSCKEKALEWKITPRAVNEMCKKGKIDGAVKEKGIWMRKLQNSKCVKLYAGNTV